MRIIRQYLLKEILSIFALSLVIVTVLFMSQRIIQLTEWSINRGIGAIEIARLLIFLLPNVLLIIIPIVTLFSTLLAVGRLSSDNEITSLKACGISLFRLTPPILLFAVFASGLALFTAQELGPKAAQATRSVFYRITRTKTEAAVVERVFVPINREVTLYVREKNAEGGMLGIMA